MATPPLNMSEGQVALTADNETDVKIEEDTNSSLMSHKELMDKVKGELAQLMKVSIRLYSPVLDLCHTLVFKKEEVVAFSLGVLH